MKKSEIKIDVTLDENRVPEKIEWSATDAPSSEPSETKAFNISLWDHHEKNSLRIDLWIKDMPVHEMKLFYLDCLSGMSQSILTATGDTHMANEITALCQRLSSYLQAQEKQG